MSDFERVPESPVTSIADEIRVIETDYWPGNVSKMSAARRSHIPSIGELVSGTRLAELEAQFKDGQ